MITTQGPDRYGKRPRLHGGERALEFFRELPFLHPAEVAAARGGRRLGEFPGQGGEVRPVPHLLEQARGITADLFLLKRRIDRQKDLGNQTQGGAAVRGDPADHLLHFIIGDGYGRPQPPRDQSTPDQLGANLLAQRHLKNAPTLEQILEIFRRHLVPARDILDSRGHLLVGHLDIEALGFLGLQAFIDQAPDHLRHDSITKLGRILLSGGQDRQARAHVEVEHGNDLVVDHGRGAEHVLRGRGVEP